MKPLNPPVILECTLVMPDGAAHPSGVAAVPLELTVECGPTATGKDLSSALHRRFGTAQHTAAGRPLDALTPGRDPLVAGCIILGAGFPTGPGPEDRSEPAAHLELVVLSGPDAGATLALRRGEHHLGRGGRSIRLTDPSLSRDHAVLSVSSEAIRWTDRGSLHGTFVDGVEVRGTTTISTDSVIRCGATVFSIRPAALWEVDLASLGETPGAPREVAAPMTSQNRLTTVMMALGPLLGGVVLAWGSGSWQFALLSLLSTAPFVYPAITGTSAARSFRAQLERAIADDRREQETSFPPLGALLLARGAPTSPSRGRPTSSPSALGVAPGQGSSVPDSSAGLWLRLGTGNVVANIECRTDVTSTRTSPAWRRAREPRAGALRWMPAVGWGPGGRRSSRVQRKHGGRGWPWSPASRQSITAVPGSVPIVHPDGPVITRADPGLLVVGNPTEYVDFVNGLIVQLLRRPRERRPELVLVDPRRVMPSSLRFLPHVRWADTWEEARDSASRTPEAAGIVAIGAPAVPPPDPAEIRADADPLSVVVHGSPVPGGPVPQESPEPRGFTVVRIDRVIGTVRRAGSGAGFPAHGAPGSAAPLGDGSSSEPGAVRFVPDLVSPEVMERFCRNFRRLAAAVEPAGPAWGSSDLPDKVALADLVPFTCPAILEAWHSSYGTETFVVPFGIGGDGPAALDLVQDGPHFLVAGTTGAGKSDLLRSLLLSAASRLPPTELGFVLVDFKGGAAFHALRSLPHVHGLVTDLGPAELDRVLVSVRAEITQRERRFRELNVSDWAAYRRRRPSGEPPLPRICLVIDEFRMMMDHAPDSLGELVRLASIGRSLGLHLILATQRPQGAISADIRANLGTRIALRVQSELDSLDVIGTALAAGIPADHPGRAVLARGSEKMMIQVAHPAAVPALRADEVKVRMWDESSVPSDDTALESPSDTERIAEWCREISTAWDYWQAAASALPPWGERGAHPSEAARMLRSAGPHGQVGAGPSAEAGVPSPEPRRVLASPLPSYFDPLCFGPLNIEPFTSEPHPSCPPDGRPALAVVDLPELQELRVMRWSPGESVALLGASRDREGLAKAVLSQAFSGRARRLISIRVQSPGSKAGAAQPLTGCRSDRMTTGTLTDASPDLGSDVDLDTSRQPELQRLSPLQEIHAQDTERIAGLVRRLRTMPADSAEAMVIHVESWEATLAAIRRSENYGLEHELLDLLRNEGNAGFRFLLGGDDGLAGGRVMTAVSHALYLPSAKIEDDRRLAQAIAALHPSSSRVLIRSASLPGGIHLAQPVSLAAEDRHDDPNSSREPKLIPAKGP